ncbi:PIG-F-domain-containing protein [Tothia fuscella]|uniref:PIG-F-domain-containing protein n=1 Tax=Tothia fuscella TaxID=1048955 RepID=A0A9P4NQC2_9PEZI|nr:PIG-F-domain-containing protein [Tothia fuscella]
MAVAKTDAINVLNTDTAKLYTHIHPILVLSAYYFNFSSIVADPVSSLIKFLIPLNVLQIAYVVICLPATGTAQPPPVLKSSGMKPAVQKKSPKGKSVSLASRITPALLSLTLSLALGTPLLGTILILFGAPLTTHIHHTILCAAHISLLSALPLIYTHGIDTDKWRRIAALMIPLDEVFGAAVGTCIGAWIGAVPIPLDWDREWQKWPITIVTGAYVGWAVGKVVGGLLVKGKVIDLRP